MVLSAVRGGIGFFTRLPIGRDEAAWEAFRQTPMAFPLAGYVVGALLAIPFLVQLPAPTTAGFFLAWVVLVTGVNHADGLADLGDAAVVHGDPDERRAVMKDTTVGVGALLALGVVLIGLALGGDALAGLPFLTAAGLVVTSEVSAKLAMVIVACTGEASHDGFGAQFSDHLTPADLVVPTVVAVPALLASGTFLPGLSAFVGGVAVAVVVERWADRRLDGVGGDVFGATNELARVVALHAGVVAWTLW